jgi:hypothetical protein
VRYSPSAIPGRPGTQRECSGARERDGTGDGCISLLQLRASGAETPRRECTMRAPEHLRSIKAAHGTHAGTVEWLQHAGRASLMSQRLERDLVA